jgi:outer membrane protein assembly factor BamB
MSSPIVHDGVLLMSSGSRRGSFQAFDITKASGELTRESDALLWVSEGDTPFVPSPIAYDGVLYSLKSNSGLLSAIDVKTGERIYGPERLDALATAYASPVAAGGHLYFAGRDGTFEVIKTGAEFETVAVNMLDDNFDASPAIAGDQIYLRGLHFLYCIAEEE